MGINNEDIYKEHLYKLQERLVSTEKKIIFYDKIIWVCGILLIIFGGSGAFGLKLLTESKEEIGQLQDSTKNLEKSISEWEKKVDDAKLLISQTREAAIMKLSAAADEQTTKSIQTLKKRGNSIYNEIDKKINRAGEEQISRISKSSMAKEFEKMQNSMEKLLKGKLHLKAQSLKIINKKGKLRVYFINNNEDNGFAGFYSKNDNVFARVGIYHDSLKPFIEILNPKDKKRLSKAP